MRTSVRNLGSGGMVRDAPAYDLQPNQLTSAVNVEFRDGAIERAWGLTREHQIPADAVWMEAWFANGNGRIVVVAEETITHTSVAAVELVSLVDPSVELDYSFMYYLGGPTGLGFVDELAQLYELEEPRFSSMYLLPDASQPFITEGDYYDQVYIAFGVSEEHTTVWIRMKWEGENPLTGSAVTVGGNVSLVNAVIQPDGRTILIEVSVEVLTPGVAHLGHVQWELTAAGAYTSRVDIASGIPVS